MAAMLALGLVAALLAACRRGAEPASGGTLVERTFVDDSLGVRLRLPDSPGWSMRRDPPGRSDGRILVATHEGAPAVVYLVVLQAGPEVTLDQVFRARQRQLAPSYGVSDLPAVVEQVLAERQQDQGGKPYRYWYALSKVGQRTDGSPTRDLFMWTQTLQNGRSYECLGMLRLPAQMTREQMDAPEALRKDVESILQSFEVR